ncbi:MAG: Ppx/GppA phosphatase family protein, partial [Acidimicrobiales bacterium]
DVGCVRISERFLAVDPPTAPELDAARREIETQLRRARAALPAPPAGGTLVGLAGTVSTIAALHLGVAEYDRDRIHHQVLERGDVDSWTARLAAEPAAARLARPGMVAGREDVIVGGALVLGAVLAVFDQARCLVSEDDILDGLVASLRGPKAL